MMRKEEPTRPLAGRALLAGTSVLSLATLLAVGCGQESGTQASTEPATETSATETEPATETPEEPATEIAGAYSDALGDVYDNMSNEQRAELAPGLSQEELTALTSEQLAALAQAQETEEEAPEGANALEATAVNTALGQLNMDEIREIFEQAESVEDFEAKINRVYAGPHLLLVQSRQEQEEAITEAFEDLDDSGTIGDTNDDLLFSFTIQRADRAARLAGRGANGYYNHSWPAAYTPTAEAPAGDFWRNFIIRNLAKAAWRYNTAAERRAEIRAQIEAYRATEAWLTQRRAARAYYRRMARDPRYAKSLVSISPARRRWRTKQPRRIVLPPPPRRMKIRVPRHPRRVKGAGTVEGRRRHPAKARPGQPGTVTPVHPSEGRGKARPSQRGEGHRSEGRDDNHRGHRAEGRDDNHRGHRAEGRDDNHRGEGRENNKRGHRGEGRGKRR